MQNNINKYIELIDRYVELQYNQFGLESALSFYIDFFKSQFVISKVQCTAFSHDSSSVSLHLGQVPLMQHDEEELHYIKKNLQTISLPENQTIHILNEAHGENETIILCRPKIASAKSLLVIPMFTLENSEFSFLLASETENCFNKEHALFFYSVTRSLAKCLRKQYGRTGIVETEYPPHPSSAVDFLHMCPCLQDLLIIIENVAPLDCNILLQGETGVGKEVFAEAIHSLSTRSTGPLVKVNCGAIPESLMESQLFGHEKGAFTGASSFHPGYFEQARNGTLFLDELGELSPSVQVRLLRVLEKKELYRIGGTSPIKVNARILTATHRDVPLMIEQGTFREDLWYRVNSFPITIPPLRKRRQDIKVLASFFWKTKAQDLKLPYLPILSEKNLNALCDYDWPGNVRELEHFLERNLIYSKINHQKYVDFSQKTTSQTQKEIPSAFTADSYITLEKLTNNYINHLLSLTNSKNDKKYTLSELAQILGIHKNTLRTYLIRLDKYFPEKRGPK